MSITCCKQCGRDTKSTTGFCHNCLPHPSNKNGKSGRSRGRKQKSTKQQWLDQNEVPRFDPIDPEADKDRDWDEIAD